MWTNFTILALVTLQRLVELYIARRNTKRLLANGGEGDNPLAVQLDEKQVGYERRLKGRIEEIIASVVGEGRTRVEVSAEFDQNRIQQTTESFDPESRVVRSTQTRNESAQTTDSKGDSVSVKQLVTAVGDSARERRLAVAVRAVVTATAFPDCEDRSSPRGRSTACAGTGSIPAQLTVPQNQTAGAEGIRLHLFPAGGADGAVRQRFALL